MIYQLPSPDAPLDQGDIIDGCPILSLAGFLVGQPESLEVKFSFHRVLVLTQTCDLANEKTTQVSVAVVLEAARLIEDGLLKAADVRGHIRAGRVYGWYFLPSQTELGLAEAIVDLHQLHTIRRDVLVALCRQGLRRARVQPLYREHLAKHFADTYSRIGLPQPYPTE